MGNEYVKEFKVKLWLGGHLSALVENTDLLTEISVAYYQDGATQEEISRKFAISRAKVGRMLKQARDEGIVELLLPCLPELLSDGDCPTNAS